MSFQEMLNVSSSLIQMNKTYEEQLKVRLFNISMKNSQIPFLFSVWIDCATAVERLFPGAGGEKQNTGDICHTLSALWL